MKKVLFANLILILKNGNGREMGGLQETSFFNYQTQRGYRQACQNYSHSSPYDKELQRLGYTPQQRRLIHNEIWHIWKARKIFSFIWLLLNKRVPIGCWRKKINLPTCCRLCNNEEEEEDEDHAFIPCPSFKYA